MTEIASGRASKKDLSIFKQMHNQPNYCPNSVHKEVCQVFQQLHLNLAIVTLVLNQ